MTAARAAGRRRLGERIGVMLVAVALGACDALLPVGSPETFTVRDYELRAPAEIAVLPAAGYDTLDGGVAAACRQAIYDELLRKGYAPLALDYVDRALGSTRIGLTTSVATVRARIDAEGVLVLQIPQIEELPRGRRGVVARAELYGPAGELLYSAVRHESFLPDAYGAPIDPAVGGRVGIRVVNDLPSRRAR